MTACSTSAPNISTQALTTTSSVNKSKSETKREHTQHTMGTQQDKPMQKDKSVQIWSKHLEQPKTQDSDGNKGIDRYLHCEQNMINHNKSKRTTTHNVNNEFLNRVLGESKSWQPISMKALNFRHRFRQNLSNLMTTHSVEQSENITGCLEQRKTMWQAAESNGKQPRVPSM